MKMKRKQVYLFLPLFAAFAIFAGSSMLYADVAAEGGKAAAGIDRAALKAEIMEELRAEMLDAARAEREVVVVPEVSQSAINAAVSSALEENGVLGGLFKGTTVGGFIDVNFLYNLRNHGEGYGGKRDPVVIAPTRENNNDFINWIGENEEDSFILENFAMFIDKPTTDEHPVGWQMHTYWGEKAKRITFFSPSSDVDKDDIFTVVTANITWDVPVAGRTVPITMGKMYTWIGYELVENIGNPNYTHGTVYNNAIPFTHMGMSFDVSEFLPSDKMGLTLYWVNGWDTFIDNNEAKSWGTYLTWEPNDDFFISLATIHGGEGCSFQSHTENGDVTQMYDIVATYAIPQVEKLSLGFNFDWGQSAHTGLNEGSSAHWWAAVGYAMIDYTDNQQGAFRYEYFDDSDGAKAFGGSMYTLTYTHNITVHENVMIRPEIRYNKYAIPSTPGLDDPLEPGDKGNTADDETIIGVGVEYVF